VVGRSPAGLNGRSAGNEGAVALWLRAVAEEAQPKAPRVVLERCGLIDPLSLDDALARDGHRALRSCLEGLTPEQVIETISASGLRGRGGAGFPTGRKWSLGPL
jgi:NADH:ubiquinone oxidoreductase subunit F (NADH-binding)